jgi:uncharacterized protein YndB with AHSA1/START domain
MTTLTYSTDIDAPPEVVFDYVSDVLRHPEWAHEKLEIERTAGTGNDAGATFAYAVHFMGTTRGTMTVMESVRPSRFVYECDDPSGLYRWTFEITAKDGGTHLRHRVEFLRESLKVRLSKAVMIPLIGNRMANAGLENIRQKLSQPAPV